MLPPSPDPFGWYATVIPVFFLAQFLGQGRLTATNRLSRVLGRVMVTVMAVGEIAALFGIAMGGPRLFLALALAGAVAGAGSLATTAFLLLTIAKDRSTETAVDEGRISQLQTPLSPTGIRPVS